MGSIYHCEGGTNIVFKSTKRPEKKEKPPALFDNQLLDKR